MSLRPLPGGAKGHASVHRDFGALPADVQTLLDATGQADFQLSRAWFQNFTRQLDLGAAQPALHVWHEQGAPVAALALLQDGPELRSLGNYYTTRYAPWLREGASTTQARQWLAALLASALREADGVHRLRLGPMAAGSTAASALQAALRDQGCAVHAHEAFQNWTLPVDTGWPAYLAARDGQLRTTLARMGKRFQAQGGRLEVLQGGPALDGAIAAYGAVYAASWKPPEPHAGFMPGLIRAAAQAGVLRLGLAWLGEQPVAAQVWLVAGGRADIYKLAHDERHKACSPGSLLTARLMQHAFEVDRVQVVDYLSGDDAYKRLWMREARPYIGLYAHRLDTARGLLGASREALGGLWRRARGRSGAAAARASTAVGA